MSVPEETKESVEPTPVAQPRGQKRGHSEVVAGAHMAVLAISFGKSRESKLANYENRYEALLELYDTREDGFEALVDEVVSEYLSRKEIEDFDQTPYDTWEAKFKGLSVKLAAERGWTLDGNVGFAMKKQRVDTDDNKE